MYTLQDLLKGVQQPHLVAMKINRLFSRYALERKRPRSDFFSCDWDNLIILDACRYDLIEKTDFPDSSIQWRWSDGSSSEEFIRYAVRERVLDDVVWATANPHVSKKRCDIFKVIDLWETAWDDELRTVPAEAVVDGALNALSEYPNKRFVVHFMQPHYPFIGESGVTLPDHATFTGDGVRSDYKREPSIWEHLEEGRVDQDAVWDAYRANLQYVLPSVKRLVDELSGKTVVTADHGNAFGIRGVPIPIRIYGHPGGLRYKPLIKVPWIECEWDQRREIEPGTIIAEESTSGVAQKRLRALGYTEN